jgi:hypothetical protein
MAFFVWARRTLNGGKWPFPTRAVKERYAEFGMQVYRISKHEVHIGFGRIVTLYHRSSTLYQVYCQNR